MFLDKVLDLLCILEMKDIEFMKLRDIVASKKYQLKQLESLQKGCIIKHINAFIYMCSSSGV